MYRESICSYIITCNVGRTLLLGLPRKQNGCHIGYIMYLSTISPHVSRIVDGCQRTSARYETGEWQNHELYLLAENNLFEIRTGQFFL